jgi:Transglutaminase-like superfamily
MRHLHRFLTLETSERRLLVEAALLMGVIWLSLGWVPFTRLRRMVVGAPARKPTPASSDPRLPGQVVWAVTALGQRAPRRATCLVKALAAQAMLARRGYPSRLRIGVTRGGRGELEAHAWVEHEGRILVGGAVPEIARFVPVAAFDSDATVPLAAQR